MPQRFFASLANLPKKQEAKICISAIILIFIGQNKPTQLTTP
jgi:hypothetical protein